MVSFFCMSVPTSRSYSSFGSTKVAHHGWKQQHEHPSLAETPSCSLLLLSVLYNVLFGGVGGVWFVSIRFKLEPYIIYDHYRSLCLWLWLSVIFVLFHSHYGESYMSLRCQLMLKPQLACVTTSYTEYGLLLLNEHSFLQTYFVPHSRTPNLIGSNFVWYD